MATQFSVSCGYGDLHATVTFSAGRHPVHEHAFTHLNMDVHIRHALGVTAIRRVHVCVHVRVHARACPCMCPEHAPLLTPTGAYDLLKLRGEI